MRCAARKQDDVVARLLVLAALVVGIVGVSATPASAHGLGGLSPTNYESVLRSVTPDVPGLHVRITDLGTKVELTNDGTREVTVLGYAGEPYLRVGPRGVFENTRSPATYLNRSTTITKAAPKSADAQATPVWRRVSTGTTAAWHDHRAHFMGGDDPPEVVRHPDQRRVVDNWKIPMRVGNEDVTARGQLIYVPPPSPWPWVVGAVLLAALVVVLSRTRGVAHGVRGRAGGADAHRDRARDRALGRVHRVVRHQARRERLFARRHRARACSASAGSGARARSRRCRSCSWPPSSCSWPGASPTSPASATPRSRARSRPASPASW